MKNQYLSLLISLLPVAFNCATYADSPPAGSCASYIVAEESSPDNLAALNPDTSRPPASMAKLMTAYVVMKNIQAQQLDMNTPVTISAAVSKIGGSQVYLKEGETFSIKELLGALMIQSANDAALALAENFSGSKEGFVKEMNLAAQDLGMKNSVFRSPHGLPPEKGQEPDIVSAADMLTLSRALLKEFPQILEYTGQSELSFRNGSFGMRNHNSLLRTFNGTDGLKTGFYNEAGFCITATAKRNGVRLIAVVMGCKDRKERDQLATKLLSEGFADFKSVRLLKANEAVTEVPVPNGLKPTVKLLAATDLSSTLRLGLEKSVEKKIEPCSNLSAPLQAGQACGEVKFFSSGKQIGSSPLITAEAMEKTGLIRQIGRKFGIMN